MNQPDEPPERLGVVKDQLRTALSSVLLLTIVTACVFPIVLFVLGRVFFPRQADGSLLRERGSVIGSALIAQDFTQPGYFHSRPSAAGTGYDASSSGGTNLSPNNPKLIEGVRQLAADYRRSNGLPPTTTVPIDAVTRSGSGLDPHISPANAALQIPRIARARGLKEDAVRSLVAEYTQGPQLGFLGSARVSVLELNLALDRAAPVRPR